MVFGINFEFEIISRYFRLFYLFFKRYFHSNIYHFSMLFFLKCEKLKSHDSLLYFKRKLIMRNCSSYFENTKISYKNLNNDSHSF